jgi:hypothetical protein
LGEFRLRYVTLRYVGVGWIRFEVRSVRYVSFSIFFHTAYTVDACALASILPSLSLIDMIYCKADTKEASIFKLIWFSLLHNVVKHVRNRTARLHCVFGSTDAYGV